MGTKKCPQVTFISIALFTIQIVSKQLHSDNMKSQKPRQHWQGTKTPSGD